MIILLARIVILGILLLGGLYGLYLRRNKKREAHNAHLSVQVSIKPPANQLEEEPIHPSFLAEETEDIPKETLREELPKLLRDPNMLKKVALLQEILYPRFRQEELKKHRDDPPPR